MNEADDLRKQASLLDITRAVNYLLAKKPMSGDKSGLLDLQIAKLYLAADERDDAKENIWKVVDNSGVLRQDSPIREPLQEVVGAYNTMEAGESDPWRYSGWGAPKARMSYPLRGRRSTELWRIS